MALGWIYILSNGKMPGLVKIGQSAMDPHARARELYTTGVPSAFTIEYKALFDDFARLERLVHKDLDHSRENSDREFFRVSPLEAVNAIRRIAEQPAKYEELSPTVSRKYEKLSSVMSAESDNSLDIQQNILPDEVYWISNIEAESDIKRGLVRDLRSGYSIPPSCPSCFRVAGTRKSSGLFKFMCQNCRESWVQYVPAGRS